MHAFSRLIKTALALTASALMLHAASARAAAPASKPAPAPKPVAASKSGEAAGEKPAPAGEVRTVALRVTQNGFEPSPVTLKRGEPVRLVVTRATDETCATDLVMRDPDISVELPLNKAVEITLTPTKSGTLKYGCAMGQMVSGIFLVE
ncbi:copper transporter [Aggregicoccus sp. 17bor-14]|uniref:cupredoxin domain-containing protein n=1 Tax=Myxococcaceae TaxID=31 RepID=UPI00129C86AD|nr:MULTISPECIES: cupredoxin domain-containing protein [Myxococcaceae]MBF5044724.1 cupredoxin domain-containing protein [Simulacricoccus sp. 17bor-14]MRI90469.1 copper transporter [Aggregicoccus sp. 17bor-14]